MTGMQLYLDYKYDLSKLTKTVSNIENTRVASLIESLWNIDEPLIDSQLQGIMLLDGVARVSIVSADGINAIDSEHDPHSLRHHSFPLIRLENEKEYQLGELQIVISLDEVYHSLYTRGMIVLLSNSVKSLVVAAVIILIYQVLIGQHVSKIARFTENYDPATSSDVLKLDRSPSLSLKPDELTEVEVAINQWIATHKDNQRIQQQSRLDLISHRDRLRELNIKLKNANDELTRFAYSTSHDLKAPLITMTGLLSFTVDDIENGDTDNALVMIRKSKYLAERLSKRIEDMLTLAQSDMKNEDWSTVNFEEIIDEIWRGMDNESNPVPAVLSKCLNHHKPLVTVKVRIQVVLENLLSNALKYASEERDKTEVRISTQCTDDTFQIIVSDNGVGIPERFHDRVFQLFQRFTNSNKPGSGLGLAIVKKNIQHLGGDISFTSSTQGTQFKISLPLRAV